MTKPASSTAPDLSGADVPAPRAETRHDDQAGAAQHAAAGLAVVRRLAGRLDEVVAELDESAAKAPSRLPGWNRQHVLSHLARNADALVNLLVWAQTGVEHPMYPSKADRDADIEEGSHRMLRVVQEDLTAATERFTVAADAMPEAAWANQVVGSRNLRIPAARVPWMRAVELVVHTVDLDCGIDFEEGAELAGDGLSYLLNQVAFLWKDRDDVAARRVEAAPGGPVLQIGTASSETVSRVTGPAPAVLGWLTGRTDGAGLTGELPELPTWL
jgi:maleylpyruvate isomerase